MHLKADYILLQFNVGGHRILKLVLKYILHMLSSTYFLWRYLCSTYDTPHAFNMCYINLQESKRLFLTICYLSKLFNFLGSTNGQATYASWSSTNATILKIGAVHQISYFPRQFDISGYIDVKYNISVTLNYLMYKNNATFNYVVVVNTRFFLEITIVTLLLRWVISFH